MANMGFGFIVSLRDRFSQKARTAGAAMGGLERKARGLKKGLGGIGFGKLAGLAGGTLGIYGMGRAVSDGTRKYLEFDEAMRKVQTLLIGDLGAANARAETDRLAESVRSLSLEFGQKATPMANALWLAISSGIPAGKKAENFLRELSRTAVTTGADMSIMTQAITDVMDNYGDEAGTAREISDAMFASMVKGKLNFQQLASAMTGVLPLGAKLGLNYKEVMASIVGLTRGTGTAAEASTKLKGIFSSLLRLPPIMRKELSMMGFDLSRTSTKERGLIETLRQLDAHMKKIDYRKVGLQLNSLGLSFKGIHMQGKNAGIAARIIVKEMEKAKWGDANVALQQMGLRLRRTAWEGLNTETKVAALTSSLNDARFGMARVFTQSEAMAGALSLVGEQGKVADAVLRDMGQGAKVTDAAFKAMESTPMFTMRKMEAQWDEVKMKLGQQFVPVLLKLGKVMETIKWDPIVDAFGRLFAALPKIIDRLINLGSAAEKAGDVLSDISGGISSGWQSLGGTKETGEVIGDVGVGVGTYALLSRLARRGPVGSVKGAGELIKVIAKKIPAIAVGAAAGYVAKAAYQVGTEGMATAPGRVAMSLANPLRAQRYYNIKDTLKHKPSAQLSTSFGVAEADPATRAMIENIRAGRAWDAKAVKSNKGVLVARAGEGLATKEDIRGVQSSIKEISSRPIDIRVTADLDGQTIFEANQRVEQREAAR